MKRWEGQSLGTSLLVKKYKEKKRNESYQKCNAENKQDSNKKPRICLLLTAAITWYGSQRKTGAGGKRCRQGPTTQGHYTNVRSLQAYCSKQRAIKEPALHPWLGIVIKNSYSVLFFIAIIFIYMYECLCLLRVCIWAQCSQIPEEGSSWLGQSTFLYTFVLSAQWWHHPQWAGLPSSAIN